MTEHKSRFMKLEKPRDGKDAPHSPLSSPGRFGAQPQQPAAAAEEPASPPGLDRFRAPPPDSSDAIRTAEAEPAEAQPFIRCALCQADSSRFARRCSHCGTDLDTADQRFFNERLWAKQQEDSKKLDEELSELKRTGAAAGLDTEAQRRLGEELARQVAERERQRLSGMQEGYAGEGRQETPGLRLLRLIPNTRLRLTIAVILFGIGCYFAYAFVTARTLGGRALPAIFFWAIVLLFVPRRRVRRRLFWD